jgi:hypothetical protein
MCANPVSSLLNPPKDHGIEVLSEKEIYFEIEAETFFNSVKSFQCKSKIDRLVIDHVNKAYQIIDLKSTSGSLEEFPNSVRYYKYHRQMAFYCKAVEALLGKGYQLFPVYTCAMETRGYNRVRLFQLDQSLLELGRLDLLHQLKRISYHQETMDWMHPMEEEENHGIYLLKHSHIV